MQVTLAGKAYDLPEQFNLGQIRRISTLTASALTNEPDPVKLTDLVWQRRLDVVSFALKGPLWPDISPEKLEEMTITNEEISAAYMAIIDHAGLVPKKESAPGEA